MCIRDSFDKVVLATPQDVSFQFLNRKPLEKVKKTATIVFKSSKNPLNELKILISFIWIFLRLNPTVIFNFTIKNNIYGSLASFLTGKKVVNNITGLGSAMLKPSITRTIILLLYKINSCFLKNYKFLY